MIMLGTTSTFLTRFGLVQKSKWNAASDEGLMISRWCWVRLKCSVMATSITTPNDLISVACYVCSIDGDDDIRMSNHTLGMQFGQ